MVDNAEKCPHCGSPADEQSGWAYGGWTCGTYRRRDESLVTTHACYTRSLEAEIERLKQAAALESLEMQRQVDRVLRLQAIVDKMDKTADGVPIVRGMVVFVPSLGVWKRINYTLANPGQSDGGFDPKLCSSTKNDLEAAGRKP